MRRAGSPGDFNRATDPWVSFSSDGSIVYSISDSFNANGPAFGGASSIIISRSTDGGVTWQTPVTARLDTSTTVLNDKETVTADSTHPLTAYATWDRLVSPSTNANPGAFNHSPAFRGPVDVLENDRWRRDLEQRAGHLRSRREEQTIGNQIVSPAAGPASGMLIDGFDLILTKGGLGNNQSATFSVAVIRSRRRRRDLVEADRRRAAGLRKRQHRRARRPKQRRAPGVRRRARGQPLRRLAGRPLQHHGRGEDRLLESTDGGLTWTTPIRVDQSPGDTPAFTPQVHVASDGTVGISYYDLESATTLSRD